MRRVLVIAALLVMLGPPAQAWQLEARIHRNCATARTVFVVENHGPQRRVLLRAGSWERHYRVPSWGGIRVVRFTRRAASVWWRDNRIVRLGGCR